jgi:hypothetical protein
MIGIASSLFVGLLMIGTVQDSVKGAIGTGRKALLHRRGAASIMQAS